MESFLIYPAILKVKYKGKKLSLEAPKQAKNAMAAMLRENGDGDEKEQHADADSG